MSTGTGRALADKDIGEVYFNEIKASDVGLVFGTVQGLFDFESEAETIRLLAEHGARAVGKNLLPPRIVSFPPEDWIEAENRARLHVHRNQIFNEIVRPALREEIEIRFDLDAPGEQPQPSRSIWGRIRHPLFADGLQSFDKQMDRFFQVGLEFVCADPLLYSPMIGLGTTETFATASTQVFELGHLDSPMELRIYNGSGATVSSGTLEVRDENSGATFAFDLSIKPIPDQRTLTLISKTWDVHIANPATGAKDRVGVADAITSDPPFPDLTRTDLSAEATLTVVQGKPTGWIYSVQYRKRFLVL